MATAAPLPLFYSALEPLSGERHAHFHMRRLPTAPFLVNQHAVPLTVEEFPLAQRSLPIVFAVGAMPVPLALYGLNEGVNVFVDGDGRMTDPAMYVPAYVRRYPFMLAKTRSDADALTLCFDPAADTIGDYPEGQPLFADGAPTEVTRGIIGFAEQFEKASQRTAQFMKELDALDILVESEMAVQPEGAEAPFVYRGFRVVDDKRLGALDAAQLGRMHQSGMLPLITAHLFSLSLMRDVFNRQLAAGKAVRTQG